MKIRDIIQERLDYREVRNWTPQQWSEWLDSQLQAGQIAKADWTDAKDAVNRQVERVASDATKVYLQMDQVAREPYSDLYWAQPHGLHELGKAEKTAIKSPDGPFKKAILDLVTTYKPLKAKLDQLKPLIVTATQQRTAIKAQQATQRQAEEGSAAALVDALKENRTQYVEEARKRALTYITDTQRRITERGGADRVAPDPDRGMRRDDPKAYEKAQQKRAWVEMIMKQDPDDYAEREARASGDSYDAWVYKLVQKIGKPVTSADVAGDPWTGSTISVTTNDGEQQTWRTQMILNTSKLGKVFNQFPTRKMK